MTDDWNERMETEAQAEFMALQGNTEWQAFFERCKNDTSWAEMRAALREHGVKGLEPYLADRRISALEKAKIGDVSELAELVRNGTILNEGEREFAAALMLGSVRSARGAPRKHDQIQAVSKVFFWLSNVDGEPREAVIARCEALFDCSRSTVEKRLSEGLTCPLTQEEISRYQVLLKFGDENIAKYFRQIDFKSE